MSLAPSPVESFKSLMEEFEAVKTENEQLKTAVESLQKQVGSMLSQIKRLKPFEPLLESIPENWVVEIRDPTIMRQLLARTAQLFGKRFNLDSSDPQTQMVSRQMIDNVVLACLRHCLVEQVRWNEVYRRYLSPVKDYA